MNPVSNLFTWIAIGLSGAVVERIIRHCRGLPRAYEYSMWLTTCLTLGSIMENYLHPTARGLFMLGFVFAFCSAATVSSIGIARRWTPPPYSLTQWIAGWACFGFALGLVLSRFA